MCNELEQQRTEQYDVGGDCPRAHIDDVYSIGVGPQGCCARCGAWEDPSCHSRWSRCDFHE